MTMMVAAMTFTRHGELRNERNDKSQSFSIHHMADSVNLYAANRKARMVMIKAQQAAPMGRKHRISSDSAWPLRGLDGKTFAERRAEREKEQSK